MLLIIKEGKESRTALLNESTGFRGKRKKEEHRAAVEAPDLASFLYLHVSPCPCLFIGWVLAWLAPRRLCVQPEPAQREHSIHQMSYWTGSRVVPAVSQERFRHSGTAA